MGTQGNGRKRNPNKDRSTAEDDTLNLIAREAEGRLALKKAARAEAREIRMKELERQQEEISDDDEPMLVGSRGSARVEDRDFLEKGSQSASTLTAATLASLGGSSSRRGSGESSITGDTETSILEIKDSLVELEEKYRKAMVSNAQLDNEKNNLMYQVDRLKDSLMELEELLSESRREYDGKTKDIEREQHAYGVLQCQFNVMKETLKQSEELLTALEQQKEYSDAVKNERDELRDELVQLKDILKKHGIVLGPDLTTNGEKVAVVTERSASRDPASQLAQDGQTSPTEGGNIMLEIRLRKLVDERENLIGQVKKLKAQVEQKKLRNGTEGCSPEGEVLENGTDPHIQDLQRDASRQLSDLKFKLVKSEQEVTALEQYVTRLEGQVTHYKGASENAEDELKAEKRKLQREDSDQHTSRMCKGYLTKKESDGVLHQMACPPQSSEESQI
ncbi:leucine-rich repeat flightless-interacting protein 2-like isoform 5-T5 [Salvelinus alpinus]